MSTIHEPQDPNNTESDSVIITYQHSPPKCLKNCSPLSPVIRIRKFLDRFLKKNKARLKTCFRVFLLLGYFAYFIGAMVHSFGDEGSIRLLVLTVVVLFFYAMHTLKKCYGDRVETFLNSTQKNPNFPKERTRRLLKKILTVYVITIVIIYVIATVLVNSPFRLVPVAGLFIFTFVLFFFSKDPEQVCWRPVLWGFLLQMVFALIVLRTSWGYDAFDWLGKRVTEFLDHSDNGAIFVFGEAYTEHFFAFKVMSVIFFFSAVISILYYLGWMQVLIQKMAFIMQYTLGISAMESLHAAVNIFVGWAETTTIVKPLFDKMTLSELHTVMTNGFATVAGSTLVVYILFGAPANHLISASVMSAPAALGISKLFWPESKESRRDTSNDACEIKKQGRNIMEAASIGAIIALPIVAYIIASVIAFFSFLGFVNATLVWLGERVGLMLPDYPPLTFQLICSYLFWPLVFLLGVEPRDCCVVARMVGIKTFINEFLAYEDLGKVIKNNEAFEAYDGQWTTTSSCDVFLTDRNQTLKGGILTEHSVVIATYALCGFSNLTALGIMIGALTAIAPNRKEDIVRVSFRALISGCFACFMTACIAGILSS
ncbi:solute carrier family 28 member 3-like [Saccostrea echinata]|uniref:solute carrier family 28 member 3-like n=1 Tax=Saccostrea echinata TaxID=191078 RepID=UPI002A829565|nr:solute carrier family 28 member 3-like [Saccostrea echinata]